MADLVVLDVNETLSDLTPLAEVFADVGLPGQADAWFAGVLRDGFAVSLTGGQVGFAEIGRAAVAARAGEEAAARVIGAFMELPAHPDVADGLRALRSAGLRVVTLSNGSTAVADALLTRAGVRDQVEALLSVEDAPRWKPAPEAYRYALDLLGVDAADAVMVAVHPWDVQGAQAVGMRGCYVDRAGAPYPSWLPAPDLVVPDLASLAARL